MFRICDWNPTYTSLLVQGWSSTNVRLTHGIWSCNLYQRPISVQMCVYTNAPAKKRCWIHDYNGRSHRASYWKVHSKRPGGLSWLVVDFFLSTALHQMEKKGQVFLCTEKSVKGDFYPFLPPYLFLLLLPFLPLQSLFHWYKLYIFFTSDEISDQYTKLYKSL